MSQPTETELKDLLLRIFLEKDNLDKKHQASECESKRFKKEAKQKQRIVDEVLLMLRYIACEKEHGSHNFEYCADEGTVPKNICKNCKMDEEYFKFFSSITSYAKTRGIK